tara:strand:+ start:24 stop:506 length:483 start_codon:yes stop_codon:yes gene_type:complete
MKFFGLISILIFLLYGCQSPYAGSGYSTSSSSTWSSNYSSYTPVKENVMVSNQSACNIKKELKDMTFGECMYEAGLSYDICEKHSIGHINLILDCSDYSNDTPVKKNNVSACGNVIVMTFGECMYEAGISYKECKANIDYASSTIKLPTDCNSRNSGSRS